MKLSTRAALVTTGLALAAAPAFAAGHDDNSGASHKPATNPGAAHKLAAPGQYCKAESKKHVAGTKGTPFSACVKAQAKLRSGATSSPAKACKSLSKKHVKGMKGTPYSVCVSAGAKLLKDKADDDAPAPTPTATATETADATPTATATEAVTATP